MDSVLTVLIFIVGIVLGWKYREYTARKQVSELLGVSAGLVKKCIESDEADRIEIEIEKHDGEFFVYSSNNKEFMANGSTRNEVELRLETRYPGRRFACTPDNLKEVGF